MRHGVRIQNQLRLAPKPRLLLPNLPVRLCSLKSSSSFCPWLRSWPSTGFLRAASHYNQRGMRTAWSEKGPESRQVARKPTSRPLCSQVQGPRKGGWIHGISGVSLEDGIIASQVALLWKASSR